jgi:histidine triad (HIT) family protein
MSGCIFCQIVAGKLPSYKIYEDEEFLAFLDLAQIVDGHTLLIPKKHCRWVWDIDRPAEFFKLAQKLAKHLEKVSGQLGVMSVTIGALVEHAHLHLLPSTSGNRDKILQAWAEARKARELSPEEMKKIAARFRLKK